MILTGAVAALLLRLLLALPADLYARVLATPESSAFARWDNPPVGSHFAKHFVLATWWVGAVAGAMVLGKRGSHWADVPCGVIAGAAAGVALSGTLACALPALDWLPRQIWHPVAMAAAAGKWPPMVGIAAAAWIVIAVVSWMGMGAVVGLVLGCAGRPGRQLLASIGCPLAWLLRCCGLKGAARLLTLS